MGAAREQNRRHARWRGSKTDWENIFGHGGQTQLIPWSPGWVATRLTPSHTYTRQLGPTGRGGGLTRHQGPHKVCPHTGCYLQRRIPHFCLAPPPGKESQLQVGRVDAGLWKRIRPFIRRRKDHYLWPSFICRAQRIYCRAAASTSLSQRIERWELYATTVLVPDSGEERERESYTHRK